GLEGLFLGGWSDTLTKGISNRTAAFLGESIEESEELCEKLKNTWDVRSDIVHGRNEEKLKGKLDKMGYSKLSQVSDFLEDTLRRALRKFLQQISKGRTLNDVLILIDETAWMKQFFEKTDRVKKLNDVCFGVPTMVLETTSEMEKDTIPSWIELHNHWIDLYYSLTDIYKTEALASNIVFRQFFTLLRNLMWHTTAMMSGAYESAARELRYIFEDMCQAFYLEQKYPEQNPEEVYEIMKENRPPRGKILIGELNLHDDIKNDMCDTMDKLHGYVHPDYQRIMENVRDPQVVLFYQSEWFSNVRELHAKTCDFVFHMILGTFPDARNHFMNKPHVISSLQEMNFEYTLHR
ncbi:MAG: hypothetical protein ACXAEN_17525, partial [Candidatus Thorarchaeota archaeon]